MSTKTGPKQELNEENYKALADENGIISLEKLKEQFGLDLDGYVPRRSAPVNKVGYGEVSFYVREDQKTDEFWKEFELVDSEEQMKAFAEKHDLSSEDSEEGNDGVDREAESEADAAHFHAFLESRKQGK